MQKTTMLIADIEDDIMDPDTISLLTLVEHQLVHKLLTRVLRIILVIVPEHPSDTYVLTMKMEILLESASNKLLVGYIKHRDGDALFQLKLDFQLPHAHAQTTKTY
ncbi:hypothetical protein Tco_0351405 [Tanacetum coccineum]